MGDKYSLDGAEELQVFPVSQRDGSRALRKELGIQFDLAGEQA